MPFLYLDESGDADIRIGRGSSRFLVVGMIVTDDLVGLSQEIARARSPCGWSSNREIKFVDQTNPERRFWVGCIGELAVSARSFSSDKKRLAAPIKQFQPNLYAHTVMTASMPRSTRSWIA